MFKKIRTKIKHTTNSSPEYTSGSTVMERSTSRVYITSLAQERQVLDFVSVKKKNSIVKCL